MYGSIITPGRLTLHGVINRSGIKKGANEMKKLISVLLLIALVIAPAALGEGLLPGFTSLFGVEMPSLSAVVLRLADEENVNSDGSRVVTYYGDRKSVV